MREVKTDTVNFSLNLADCSPAVTNVVMQTLQNTFDSLRKVIETDKEEQKKKETKNHWKPITSEKYFFTYSNGDVDSVIWTENKADKGRYGLRNVFRTKEEAEFEVERRKVMIELQNYADEHNGETAHPSDAFWIAFDEDDMSITVETESYLPPVGAVLFSDADTAYDAIEAIGENRILEYMFRVNPKYMFRVNPNKELHCNGDCECCDEYDPWDEEDED